MAYRLPKSLANIPWATMGRRESRAEIEQKCEEQRSRAPLFSSPPRITVIVDTTDGVDPLTLESVRAQSYVHWELIQLSNLEELPELVRRAQGEWICFIKAGNLLSPAALFMFVSEMRGKDSDVYYANDVLLNRGRFAGLVSKRSWSWLSLIHHNFIGEFFLVRKSLLEDVVHEPISHATYLGMLLELSRRTTAFQFVPYYLLYRPTPWEEDPDASLQTVRAHLSRMNFEALVKPVQVMGRPRIAIIPEVPSLDSHVVSVVMCFRDSVELTKRALDSIVKSSAGISVEVILMNNQSQISSVTSLKDYLRGYPLAHRWVDFDEPFNFARMNNLAVREHAKGNLILLLNNDVELDSGPEMIRILACWSLNPEIATVGCRLRYPDGRVQYGGFVARPGRDERLVRLQHLQRGDLPYEAREVFCATFAACIMRRKVFEQLGGLDEITCANGSGDIIFTFEALRRGMKHLYLGWISGMHRESASRGITYEYWEESEIAFRYSDILCEMLRGDLGTRDFSENSLPTVLAEYLRGQLRERAPWLTGRLKGLLRRGSTRPAFDSTRLG